MGDVQELHPARWEGWRPIPCEAAEQLIDAGMVKRNPIGSSLDTDSEVVVEWVSPNGTPIMRDVFRKGGTLFDCVHWILDDTP